MCVGNVPQIRYIVGMGQNNHWNHFILSDRPHSSGSSSLSPLPRCFPVHPWLWVTSSWLSSLVPFLSSLIISIRSKIPLTFSIQNRNDFPSVVFTLCSQDPPSVLYVEKRQFLTPMFIAAPFTITKMWQLPKYPLIDEWVNKMWYIHI